MEKYFAIRRAKPVPETSKKLPESCMNSERNENRNWKKYLSGKVTFLYIVTCISYWFKEKASRDTWMSPRQAST